MNAHAAPPFLNETLLFLVLSGVLIPLLQRLRINPVLGFLAVGTLLGPYGLARFTADAPWLAYVTFPRHDDVEVLAELGVIFLMFMIGLEMSVDRLWSMRRLVFGMGALQVVLSALVIGALASAFGNRLETAVVLGLVLAFSSTAIVMELLAQRRELGTPLGQAAFAILLFQDLAVVPLLVLVGVLGEQGQAGFLTLLGTATAKGVITVALIYLVGRRVVRPLFHQIAAVRQADTFMALTLLSTIGVAALTWAAGLSMALGALLAGLIIAETEFRHEVEVTIEPFKGLLMGLFFMSVGMGIDVRALAAEPLWTPLSVIGLLLLKGVVLLPLLRLFGLSWGRATEGGFLLSQGGEFAFIVIGLALSNGLLTRNIGQFMLLVVGLSMITAPFAARLGRSLGDLLDRYLGRHDGGAAATELGGLGGHVIVAGFGRVGQMVGQLLAEEGVPFVAVETDAKLVEQHRASGAPVFYGDASRPELLRRLQLARASAVVLTMDHTAAAVHAVRGVRQTSPSIRIIARARDEKHAMSLRQAGASVVIPETLESGLQLAGSVLESLGVPNDAANRLLERERERRIVAFREA